MRWRRQNLRGLSRHDPALAERLEHEPEPGLFELRRGNQGAWTLRRRDSQGRVSLLHSMVDPQGQARRALDAALSSDWLNGKIPELSACLLLGTGLGWPALAAAEMLPPSVGLWIADPSSEAFSYGLDCLDFSSLFDRKRVRFLFGPPNPELAAAGKSGWVGGGAFAAAVTEGVLDSEPGGREWARSWIRTVSEAKPRNLSAGDGLPPWLRLVQGARLRGELP